MGEEMLFIKKIKKNRKIRRDKPQLYLIPDIPLAYIQIPKVASRSIRQALTNHIIQMEGGEKKEVLSRDIIRKYESNFSRHLSQKTIREYTQNCFLFAFVRHPIKRLYSCYMNKVLMPFKQGGKNIFFNHNIPLGIEFKEFVSYVYKISDHRADRHFRSQSWFLYDKLGLLPDYVGKLEQIDKDWSVIDERFGIKLPRKKNVGKIEKKLHFDQEILDMISDRYGDDFVNFGYELEDYDRTG